MRKLIVAFLALSCIISCKSKEKTASGEETNNNVVADANFTLDPANTYVLIAGVLTWKDPNMNPFNNTHRKDEELYNLFVRKGVKKDNIIYLQDSEATNANMQSRLKELLERAEPNSTFIFYYAGHGAREGNGPMSFANYDYSAGNAFEASLLTKEINSLFKGKQVLLLADCCYSGALME